MAPTEATYSIEAGGVVNQLADMLYARYLHGVTYSATHDCVYVFGGHRGSGANSAATDACESLSLSADAPQWQPLPSMNVARKRFNPCWFRDAVILCGSLSPAIDVFTPDTSIISQLEIYLPEAPSACILFTDSELLVIITDNFTVKYVATDTSLLEVSKARHKKCAILPSCSPQLHNRAVWVVSDSVCHSLDSASGEVLCTVSA